MASLMSFKLIKYTQDASLCAILFEHDVPFMDFACHAIKTLINVGQTQAVKDDAPVMRHIID